MRLPDFDYGHGGAYFVTIVTLNRELLFLDEAMRGIVDDSWHWLAERYPYLTLEEFVVMQNHLHGILLLEDVHFGERNFTAQALGQPHWRLQDGLDSSHQPSETQPWNEGVAKRLLGTRHPR